MYTLPEEHVASLQEETSVASPLQKLPPYCGTGLLHSRVLVFTLGPQVFMHGPYDDHEDQAPFTIIKAIKSQYLES